MIVVAIIAAVVAIGAPKIMNKKGQMRGEVQRIAVLSREIHTAARLQNRTFRLVFDLDPKGHKFFVESAPGQVQLLTAEQQKDLESRTSDRQEELAELSGSKFQLEPKFVKEPTPLAGGLRIDTIEYAGRNEAVTSGEERARAVIHYFPQGLAEQALIQFSDGKTLAWTIAIHPLTGKAYVHDKRLTLKDINQ